MIFCTTPTPVNSRTTSIVDSLLEADAAPVDPLDPEPSMGEVRRHLPTKEVRLRGSSMLFAPNIIRMAQNEWKIGRKKQKAWALELIKSWQGLPDQLYLDILNGKCDITEDGDDAVIIIRQY